MSQHDLDRILREAVDNAVVPGVVVAVATPAGTNYLGAAGLAHTGTGAPIAGDTVFRISSLTKSVVATALMQLVERGVLRLDQTVASVIPEFGDIPVLEGFDGDTPVLRAPRTPATIAQLATHTSGLAYDVWSEKILRYQQLTGAPSSLPGRTEGLFLPLAFDPGTAWAYGTGTDWVGEVIERVSGRRIDDYLRAEVFEPLGMRDTAFTLDDSRRTRLAAVHARDGAGFVATDFDWAPSDRVLSGHGLYSTVEDYTRFLQMLMSAGAAPGGRILRSETVGEMTRDRIGEVEVPVMRSTMPHLSCDAEFLPGTVKRQSIGFQTSTAHPEGLRAAGSQFWAGLFNLFYWWDPSNDLAVVFATQLLPFQDPAVMALFERVERAVYASRWS